MEWLKKIGYGILGAIMLAPVLVFAVPSSVDRITDHIQPLLLGDFVKAQYFTATSTTNHSTFPFASTTALSATTICFTGDLPCRTTWPSGSSTGDPFTHPAAGQSATTSLMLFNGNASTTQLSAGKGYFGLTATTTIDGTGNIVIPSGSSLTNTGVSNGCATWATGVLTSTGVACGSGSGGLTSYDAFTHPFALSSATTTLMLFNGAASTTLFSAYGPAYFGATATSSFATDGKLTLISPLLTSSGGTGLASFTQGDLPFYTSGTALSVLAKDTNSTRYLSNQGASNAPSWNQVNLANGVTGDLPFANLTQVSANSVLGNNTAATADAASIATSTLYGASATGGFALTWNNGQPQWVATTTLANITGTLNVNKGGTGQTTFTSSQLLYGNLTNALSSVGTTTLTSGTGVTVSAGAGALVGGSNATVSLTAINANSVLGNVTGASAIPTSLATSSLFTFPWTVANGGTGQSTFTSSQILYGNGTNALSSVATSSLATGLGLSTSGSAALVGSSQLTLSIATSSLFTGTLGQVPYFSGTNTLVGTSSIFIDTTSNVGIATTSPWALLSINAPAQTNPYFAIGSSTATVLSISPSGSPFLSLGSTTPWGYFSIQPATFAFATPLIAVATSTTSFDTILTVQSTTTEMNALATLATDLSSVISNGVRVVIGNFAKFRGLVLDQLNVNGRINTGDWMLAECNGMTAPQAATADLGSVCGDWGFQEDTDGHLNNASFPTSAVSYVEVGAGLLAGSTGAAAGTGGMFTPAFALNFSAATNTPVLEGAINASYSFSATSTTYFGFTNINPTGTAFETTPTAGCYITASSTQSNWKAVCSTTAAQMTIVDTGIASTTPAFTRFRIEMDNNEARFFVQGTSTLMTKLTTMSGTNYPATVLLDAGLTSVRVSAGQTTIIQVDYVRLWWRSTLWGT